MTEPIYTSENVTPAWQLIYSLTVFWKTSPGTDSWLADLSEQVVADGLRILEHRFSNAATSMFLISTTPGVPPVRIPARIKGRLQHLLKSTILQPFQRNYDLVSVGSTRGEKTEEYVRSQVERHLADDEVLRRQFADLQIMTPDVDLLQPRYVRRGRCTCNLHLVLMHFPRERVECVEKWGQLRDMIRRWANSKRCLLSRVGLLPDHLHLTFGLNSESPPLEAALTLMNNIAWVHGMRPILMPSFHVSTFGRYDLGAIQHKET